MKISKKNWLVYNPEEVSATILPYDLTSIPVKQVGYLGDTFSSTSMSGPPFPLSGFDQSCLSPY